MKEVRTQEVRTQYLPLVKAIYEATGQTVHLSTALRWCFDGRSGCKLRSWVVGGRRRTTVESVEKFIDETTAASASRTPTQREQVKSSVAAQLAKELA